MKIPSRREYHTHPLDPFVIKPVKVVEIEPSMNRFDVYKISRIKEDELINEIFYVPKGCCTKIEVNTEYIKFNLYAKIDGQNLELSNFKISGFSRVAFLMDMPLSVKVKIPTNEIKHFLMLEKVPPGPLGKFGSCIPGFYLDQNFKLISFGQIQRDSLILVPYYLDSESSIDLKGALIRLSEEDYGNTNTILNARLSGQKPENRKGLVKLVQANDPEGSFEEKEAKNLEQAVDMSILIDGLPVK